MKLQDGSEKPLSKWEDMSWRLEAAPELQTAKLNKAERPKYTEQEKYQQNKQKRKESLRTGKWRVC